VNGDSALHGWAGEQSARAAALGKPKVCTNKWNKGKHRFVGNRCRDCGVEKDPGLAAEMARQDAVEAALKNLVAACGRLDASYAGGVAEAERRVAVLGFRKAWQAYQAVRGG
jgi:hypothetical protein